MWTYFHVSNSKGILHIHTLIWNFFPVDWSPFLIGFYQMIFWLIFTNFYWTSPSPLQLIIVPTLWTFEDSLAFLLPKSGYHISYLFFLKALILLHVHQLVVERLLRQPVLLLYDLHLLLELLCAFSLFLFFIPRALAILFLPLIRYVVQHAIAAASLGFGASLLGKGISLDSLWIIFS